MRWTASPAVGANRPGPDPDRSWRDGMGIASGRGAARLCHRAWTGCAGISARHCVLRLSETQNESILI